MRNNLSDAFLDGVRAYAGKVCLTEGDREWRYDEIGAMACAAAPLIAAREPRNGAPVGLLIPNSSLFAVGFFGTLIARRVAMPINPLRTGKEIASQFVDSGARLLLTVAHFRPLIEDAQKALGNESKIDIVYADEFPQPNLSETQKALDRTQGELDGRPEQDPDALALLLYTSGSTGMPKGAMLTHGNLLSNVGSTHAGLGVLEDDVFLAVLPYFHIFGLTCCLLLPILSGNHFVVVPRFSVDEIVRVVREARVTLLLMVPTMYYLIVKSRRAEREDFATARVGAGA